jgi:hypothetical protein
MSAPGTSAADPDELDAYVHAMRALTERERAAARRLEVALDATGPARRDVEPAALRAVRALRLVVAQDEAAAAHVAASAASFRAADTVLTRLVGDTTTTRDGSEAGSTILPAPDVSVDWSWPPEWTVDFEWGGARGHIDVELGTGVRAGAGAGLSVTREAIRVGTFAESRIGAWAIAAAGTALGPFAATARGEVFAGARTRAEALLHIGRDGARAHLGGEAFAGGKAEADLRGGIGPVQAGAHGAVSYGAGLTGDADIDLSLHRVGGRVKLGAALGLGWEGGVEYYLEPAWIADGLAQVGDDALEVGASAVDASIDVAGDALDVAGDAGGSVLGAIGSVFG